MSKSAAPILDFMGREIVAGNTVVYPVRRGSSMWMQELSVTQVTGGADPSILGFNPTGRKVTLHNVGNVTIVQPRERPPTNTAAGCDRKRRNKVTRTRTRTGRSRS